YYILFFFFFQAEDGIRDRTVTGVQTCALPISVLVRPRPNKHRGHAGKSSTLPRRASELRARLLARRAGAAAIDTETCWDGAAHESRWPRRRAGFRARSSSASVADRAGASGRD